MRMTDRSGFHLTLSLSPAMAPGELLPSVKSLRSQECHANLPSIADDSVKHCFLGSSSTSLSSFDQCSQTALGLDS
jgi:hypothetical protein